MNISRILGVMAVVGLTSGCAFIEAATQQIFSNEQGIPEVRQDISWPSVDELANLDPTMMAQLQEQGFPESLAQGTFAHLQGALQLTGDCAVSQTLDDFANDPVLKAAKVNVVSCTEDTRCADQCPDDFYGMTFEADVTVGLLDAATAAEIAKLGIGPSAIVQIRFLMNELEFYQQLGGGNGNIHDAIENFELTLANDAEEEVIVIRDKYLDSISEETPQRFDVDSENAFTAWLKDNVVQGNLVDINVRLRMRIPQEKLYDVMIDGAGVDLWLQPEIVISVLEVVKDKLN